MESNYQKVVSIQAGKISLRGELVIPAGAKSIVIFSHGSGSSRFSMRNKHVANGLHLKNIGTLLFDLLTEAEDIYYRNRFDINLLTDRLVTATRWLEVLPNAKDCVIGYFGASTGAASALKAAASMHEIGAVVSRGGRPDLAREDLSKVKSPTLLIVGSLDPEVIQLNKDAFAQLKCEKKLTVVEGATHLFEESGKMEIVSTLAANWFENHLTSVEV